MPASDGSSGVPMRNIGRNNESQSHLTIPVRRGTWKVISTVGPPPVYAFRRGTAADHSSLLKDHAQLDADSGRRVRCQQCGHVLASLADRVAIGGHRQSVHINPNGVSFRLEFYRRAAGCLGVGPNTAEHTWFAGHQWQVALCAPCRAHVGWRFRAAGESGFHGLIVDHISHSQ